MYCFVIIIVGNSKLDNAVSIFHDSVTNVGDIVNAVIDDAASLVSYGGYIITDVSQVAQDVNECEYAKELDLSDFLSTANSTAYSFQTQSDSISSKTDDVNKYIDKAHSYIDLYGQNYRFKFICAIWLISILAVLLISFTHCCRAKCGMQTILLYAWIVFLIYIILGAIWGYFVTTMGAFCQEPIYNLNKQVPSSMRKYTMYYTACQGEIGRAHV